MWDTSSATRMNKHRPSFAYIIYYDLLFCRPEAKPYFSRPTIEKGKNKGRGVAKHGEHLHNRGDHWFGLLLPLQKGWGGSRTEHNVPVISTRSVKQGIVA